MKRRPAAEVAKTLKDPLSCSSAISSPRNLASELKDDGEPAFFFPFSFLFLISLPFIE